MDAVDELISAFCTERTREMLHPDSESNKVRIVAELEADTTDPRVLSFYLAVAADPTEFDLARIEVLKCLHVLEVRDEPARKAIAEVIAHLLNGEADDDVLNYATIAASSYMNHPSVNAAVERILFDGHRDPNIRANAFAAFSDLGPTSKAIEVLQRAGADDQFRLSAARILKEWKALSK